MSQSPLHDQLQRTLGATYTLTRELAGGGMARVFLAREEALGRDVVIKVLSPDLAAGISAERFARELRLTAALQAPHIVPVHAAGTTDEGLPWYTMPFVAGRSLRDRMDQGRIPLPDALDILRDIAKALVHAHAHGVVHRDIKPDNILLSGDTAVVTDFGIARALQSSAAQPAGGTLTQIGTSLGTPAYMAPEQAAGDPDTDHRADLYAWGMLAYEVLSGTHPFADKTSAQALIVAHFLEIPAPLRDRVADVPGAVAEIVMRCLAKEPDARPSGAGELLESLRAGVATDPGRAAGQPSTPERSIAVLPFESLSPAPDDAFLADGLCEEIMTDLARLKSVRVISRNSSSQYRASPKDPRAIGRELGARFLLSGSVRRAGTSLRVTAQLTGAEDGMQAWADRFTGTIEDVFEFQERIAREIVSALHVTLSPDEDRRLSARSIENIEAYECYLRARQLTLSFDVARLEEAMVLLDRATALAGDSAPLLATRAAALWNLINVGARDVSMLAESRALVDRALAVDPDLGPALVTRGLLEMNAENMDAGLAVRLLRRAADTERSIDGLLWFSLLAIHIGRPEAAAPYLRLARQLDPLSQLAILTATFLACAVGTAGSMLDEATPELQGLPADDFRRVMYGMMAATAGHSALAASLVATYNAEGHYATVCRALGASLAGDRATVAALAADPVLTAVALRDDQVGWTLSQALVNVGLLDEGLEWLQRGAERSFVNARLVGQHDAMLAPLRAHPGFPALLAHMERRSAEISVAAGI